MDEKEYDLDHYGLFYMPDLGEQNDEDIILEWVRKEGYSVPIEYSANDLNLVMKEIKDLGENCKAILEIGINKYTGKSFTTHILSVKQKDCIYLGVDINPASCGGLENDETHTHALCCDSGDYEKVTERMKQLGIDKLDFIFIDGWHSLNQVLKDWRYAVDFLSDHGVVCLHDTNCHPGPKNLLKALDPKKWKYKKYFEEKNDWGVATVKRV